MAELVRQTQLDRDRTALANPESAEQVMEIGKRSSKLYGLLKGMQGYEEEYYKAFEVMIEAYRVMGQELLKAQVDTPRTETGKFHQVSEGNLVPKLFELGITKKQAFEWRTIAMLPRTEAEDYILTRKHEHEAVTKTAILELANNYKSAQQRYDEEIDKVIAAMNVFIIQARKVTNHRLKYGDLDMKTKPEFFETSKLCEEILSELNRTA